MIDVDAVALEAFAIRDELGPVRLSAWHAHEKHQLLYASDGAMHFEIEGAQWMLPPQRAAWIPAGVSHRVRVTASVDLRTVYFAHASKGATCVFGVSPLAREMLLEATRWGPELETLPSVARSFFEALRGLAEEWRKKKSPFCLPRAKTPELDKAMRYVLTHLAEPSMEEAAKVSGLSTRSLERRFATEASTSWRKFVHAARMMRAMELLPGSRVTDVAMSLGFASFGAFSTAFQRFTGETPSAYRDRSS